MEPWYDLPLVIGVALIVVILGIALVVLWKIVTDRIDLTYLIAEPDNKASLSRFQFLIFTFVVAGVFLLLCIESGTFVEIPESVLALALAAPAAAQPAPPRQDPAQLRACVSRFAVIGMPRHRSEEARAEQFIPVICRRGYALSFNKRTLNPDWVMERLTPAELRGTAVRRDNFGPDEFLGALSPAHADFTGSGLDRGHQAPAADAKFDQRVMDESFRMSNMSPQQGPGFNRGQWKYLEEAVRAWVVCGGRTDVMVMTGPIYGDSTRTIGPRKILVPVAYYKIVYDVRSQRAVGFRLANKKYKKTDLAEFVVPISDLEDDTGLDFFPALSRRKQQQLETPKGVVWGHGQKCDNIQE